MDRTTAPKGEPIVTAHVDPESRRSTARLIEMIPAGKRRLSTRPAPRGPSQRWWIGAGHISEFRAHASHRSAGPIRRRIFQLRSSWLMTSRPNAITAVQQHRLMQYVRNLGGG